MVKFYSVLSIVILFLSIACSSEKNLKIDRKSVVNRHLVHITEIDTLNSLSLGNGRFAMTMDITGLQTFPTYYKNGIPLGTMSEWGWHSFPTSKKYTIEETLDSIESHARKVPYAVQWPADTEAGKASNYLRQNPHRIHLATVGWFIEKSDGSKVEISDIQNINQTLNVWKGELISKFEVEGVPVKVISLVSQKNDVLGVKIESSLLNEGRIGLDIKYPYPTNQFLDEAATYNIDEPKRLIINTIDKKQVAIKRELDSTSYSTSITSSIDFTEKIPTTKGFILKPRSVQNNWEFTIAFSEENQPMSTLDFNEFRTTSNSDFEQFWNSGAMIDFGNVKDVRAAEIERRMVLSLYLTKINCGGSSPPQETGLTYNSWYGKPHMEMLWWHGVHFALWNRSSILEKQLNWYLNAEKTAKKIAERQGFEGVRWQKMTDNAGGETSSSIGSYLIWQQPHIIHFAELLFLQYKNEETLKKYESLVESTAQFMADFAFYDSQLKRYILGPGVIPAQERFNPKTTTNPTFELAYWRWGLETAQKWRERLGKKRMEKWDAVLNDLSPLPEKEGLYLATESSPDSYTNKMLMTDHPSVLGAFGMLPKTKGLDTEIMKNTFEKVWNEWQWNETWGWDFPMLAMTATRLGYPEKAIDALLMPFSTNTYLKNGHNYQNKTLRLYLPGNGGFLTALAFMINNNQTADAAKGFPETWNVKYEGFPKMP